MLQASFQCRGFPASEVKKRHLVLPDVILATDLDHLRQKVAQASRRPQGSGRVGQGSRIRCGVLDARQTSEKLLRLPPAHCHPLPRTRSVLGRGGIHSARVTRGSWCGGPESNRHGACAPRDSKTLGVGGGGWLEGVGNKPVSSTRLPRGSETNSQFGS
jgi:hypothetical protein